MSAQGTSLQGGGKRTVHRERCRWAISLSACVLYAPCADRPCSHHRYSPMRPRLSPLPPPLVALARPRRRPLAPTPGSPALPAGPVFTGAEGGSLSVAWRGKGGRAFPVASPAASPPYRLRCRPLNAGSVRGPPRRRTRLAGGCCAGSSGRRLGRGEPSLASRHRPARLVEGAPVHRRRRVNGASLDGRLLERTARAHLVEESLGEEGRRHLLEREGGEGSVLGRG